MALITYSVKNMIGGVSFQPPSVRLPNQCSEMTNCVPSAADFLKRRNGSLHIAKILETIRGDAFVDFIRRGDREVGLLIIQNGVATVFDLAGNRIGSIQSSYLYCNNYHRDLKLLTVKDYSFVLNKAAIVGKNPVFGEDNAAYVGNWPIVTVFIKQAAYATKYSVTVRGKEYSYSTPTREAAAQSGYILSSSLIAAELHKQMTSEETPLENASAQVYKNILVIKNAKTSGSYYYGDYKVSCDDGVGGSYMSSFSNSVQLFSQLPLKGVNGNIVRIHGDKSSQYDDYYVEFVTDNGEEISEGYWRETSKGDLRYVPSNMPIALKIDDNGLSLHNISWKTRVAGDDITCPEPSFMGRKIQDMFFYNNRLCFITEDSLSMSEVGEYFNFFSTTACALLASDPIDSAISSQKVSPLKYAVVFNEGLFLFSDTAVFAVEHGEPLSPDNVYINPIIQFDSQIVGRPQVIGTGIFYTNNCQGFSSVMEYYPGTSQGIYGYTQDISAHVHGYIPPDIRNITGSMEESMVFAVTGGRDVYLYKFQQGANGERIQGAWCKWQFGGKVLKGEVINGVFYMVIDYGADDGVYLEKIDLSATSKVYKDRAGYKDEDFVSRFVFSPLYIRQSYLGSAITEGRVSVRWITLKYEDSGQFKVIINRKNRKTETRLATPTGLSGEYRAAVLAPSDDVEICIESHEGNGFKFTESRFEVLYSAKSRYL